MHDRNPRSAASCRACGSVRADFLCQTFNEHSRTAWLDNFRCAECGSVFIGNEISGEELEEAYGSLDVARYYAETASSSAEKFRLAARELAELIPLQADVIDIGAGDGAFARTLREQGFSSVAVHEIPGPEIPDMADVVRAVYRDTDYAAIPDASFDAVTMMDVLEHVREPAETLRAASRILRPEGLLYLHTPVVTRIDRLFQAALNWPFAGAAGRAWQRTRTSIFHLRIYSRNALPPLLDRQGFDIVRFDCRNELSWPLLRYVRVYLVEKQGLPAFLAPAAAALLAPLLRSRLNDNKAVIAARLRRGK